MSEAPKFSPSEFITVVNETLEYGYSGVLVEGEVASFKINQGKWVFFDLKDEETSVSCFMSLWSLKMPIEDGMKIVVRGVPKLTKWGKFSLTVSSLQPVGEGSLKKSFEMLKKKLAEEGLFDLAKKRKLPEKLTKLGVVSSTGAAGYADFIKILNARWGGIKVSVAHTQVQGMDAAAQITRALKYFNERGEVEAIAIIRGGGSADDLAAFNDEELVRAIAASKIPVITGIGHEVDESLSDFAADVRASTPSNAAEMLTRDREVEIRKVRQNMIRTGQLIIQKIDQKITIEIRGGMENVWRKIESGVELVENELRQRMKLIEILNPEKVLKQGYAILSGKISPGSVVKITTKSQEIKAEVKEIYER
ncbi:MAG: exodeoxyribonuclease VII large subunit [Candidatus Saccharibacteria bacterium]|nr:exodeoxyribonuclease VII large subunit [Candidatus Saccharibacteria bacterium]